MDGMEASFCSCDMDATAPGPFHERHHIARKEYACCECDCPIMPGDKYEYSGGKWEDYWRNFRTCLPCARIRNDYCAPYRALRETLWDLLGIDYLGEWEPKGDHHE